MPGETHSKVQKLLAEQAEALGLQAIIEYTPSGISGYNYRPRYDVAWIASIPTKDLLELLDDIGLPPKLSTTLSNYFNNILVSLIEITGTDASSKTLRAEAFSMSIQRPLRAYLVVPASPFDAGRRSTGMNLKRAERIVRLVRFLTGYPWILTLSHDQAIGAQAPPTECMPSRSTKKPINKRKININGISWILELWRDHTPSGLSLIKNDIPKIKVDYAVTLRPLRTPQYGAIQCITNLDLLGIEIEKKTTFKHALGDLLHLSTLYYAGLVAAPHNLAGPLGRALRTLNPRGRILIATIE